MNIINEPQRFDVRTGREITGSPDDKWDEMIAYIDKIKIPKWRDRRGKEFFKMKSYDPNWENK